jgi:hypothetical protein
MGYRSVMAIDPGINTGWAYFGDGHLHDCGIHTGYDDPPMLGLAPCVCVLERPVIYPHAQQTARPADIIKLAILMGDLRGFYRRAGYDIHEVEPRKWKGTVPKAIHQPRIIGLLSTHELDNIPRINKSKANPLGYDNNTLDAIGLGLFQLGRLGR